MSTRSHIGYLTSDGSVLSVYCHSDGYPEYVGKVLHNYYNLEATRQLIEMGDLSMLGKTIGSKIKFGDALECDSDNVAIQCRFYARDRGETLKVASNQSEMSYIRTGRNNVDYLYLLKPDGWYVMCCYKDERAFQKL